MPSTVYICEERHVNGEAWEHAGCELCYSLTKPVIVYTHDEVRDIIINARGVGSFSERESMEDFAEAMLAEMEASLAMEIAQLEEDLGDGGIEF